MLAERSTALLLLFFAEHRARQRRLRQGRDETGLPESIPTGDATEIVDPDALHGERRPDDSERGSQDSQWLRFPP